MFHGEDWEKKKQTGTGYSLLLDFFLLQSSVIESLITFSQAIHFHLLSIAKNNPFISQAFYVTVCIYFSLSFILFYLHYCLALQFGTKQDLCHFNIVFFSYLSQKLPGFKLVPSLLLPYVFSLWVGDLSLPCKVVSLTLG